MIAHDRRHIARDDPAVKNDAAAYDDATATFTSTK
jgi:hypothetical protein